MGHLKINCDCCGSSWNVYHRDDFKDWKARTCPMCGKSIDQATWDRQVLPAFGAMEDVSLELVKDHSQYHESLFTIDYIADVVFPNKGNSEIIDQLTEEIEDLRTEISDLKTKLIVFQL